MMARAFQQTTIEKIGFNSNINRHWTFNDTPGAMSDKFLHPIFNWVIVVARRFFIMIKELYPEVFFAITEIDPFVNSLKLKQYY